LLLGILFPALWVGTFTKGSNERYRRSAILIDELGNTLFSQPFNLLMGSGFGELNETISSRLGKNERDKTLKPFGKLICKILNKLDKDHCKNSIK
jgi:hypothetical protein